MQSVRKSYVTVITKCERKLLQSVTGITKSDRTLLQSIAGIAKCDNNIKWDVHHVWIMETQKTIMKTCKEVYERKTITFW